MDDFYIKTGYTYRAESSLDEGVTWQIMYETDLKCGQHNLLNTCNTNTYASKESYRDIASFVIKEWNRLASAPENVNQKKWRFTLVD